MQLHSIGQAGQAPVKSAAPFHICENLTGQALVTYKQNWAIYGLKDLRIREFRD